MKKTLVLAVGAIAAAGCVSVDTDANEKAPNTSPTIVEFDPGNSVVPFPNNLLLDRTTGKVNLPAQCGESPLAGALRQLVVNALDGFGTFKTAMRVTFTKPVDLASLVDPAAPMDPSKAQIRMYRRATGTTVVPPEMAQAIPLAFLPPGKTTRFDSDCTNPREVDSLTIVPRVPLSPRSTYTIVVLAGVKAADGSTFGASSTWGLVRQAANPVTVENGVIVADTTPLDPNDEVDKATLLGLDLLWKAHAQGLGFATAVTQKPRGDVLLSWEFTTQTTTTPLDPAVAGTPANTAPKTPLTAVTALTNDAPAHMQAVLTTNFGAPAGTCALIGCADVGGVFNGTLSSPVYQSPGANPMTGGAPVPGPFSNPVTPMKLGADASLNVQIFTPDTTLHPRPGTGWPTVVFGHGLGGSRSLSYLIASQLAKAGFATVAIDFVAHGERAVRTSNAAALGCDGTPSPSTKPQCFAPIFSTNLATTRDNIRQSVLDVQRLINALGACTTAAPCGTVAFDSARVGYMGISLGGIIGSVISSTMNGAAAPNVKASVLNVPAVGLVDVLENTQTLAIRCSTVDGLIDAGIVTGTKWNGISGPGGVAGPTSTGTCVGDEWKAQPGYLTFSSIARWVLDSSDGANFVGRLPAAGKKFLIQKVVGDTVVPNVATDTMAALTGLAAPGAADTTAGATLPLTTPSAAITTNLTTSKWVTYTSTAEYVFRHGSLLSGAANPAAPTTPELLGTNRVQLDAITFLSGNL